LFKTTGDLGGWRSGKEIILKLHFWRFGERKGDNDQCKLGGWGRGKSDNFTSASLEVGEQKRDNINSASLEVFWGGKETILPVQAWRLGEQKRDNFSSASLEVGGAEKRQY
jgi:hypothetical protein